MNSDFWLTVLEKNCKNLDNIRKTIELEKQGEIGSNYIGKPVGKNRKNFGKKIGGQNHSLFSFFSLGVNPGF